MNWIFVGILLVVGGYRATTASVSCRNENGEAVDWYILYKQPNIDSKNGLKYLYVDESTNGWIPGKYNINEKESALGQTLQPLFDHLDSESESFGYVLYNDQPPVPYKTASSTYGHSKGVVLLDKETGIWLSHSVPDLPGFDINSFWPDSGYHNGQTFICGAYEYSAFKEIAIQLKYIHVNSFNSYIPESFYPELHCVVGKGCYPREEPYYRQLDMTTLGGHKFVSYAKYGRLHDDLYSAVLDKHMDGDFYVHSWGRLRHPLPSNCSVSNIVYNVEQVQLPTTEPFKDTIDHSKWCVTVDQSAGQWTCIADMNREISQESRGGGAVCTDHPAVWNAFSSIVFDYQPCAY